MTSPHRTATGTLALAAALALALTGCSSDGPDPATSSPAPASAAPATSAPAAPAATTAPTAPAAPVAPAAGCAAAGTGVPAGVASVPTIDLDGDGTPDTLWVGTVDGARTVGVTTASGATFTHPVTVAGPQGATAFALRPDEAGPADVLVSDGRRADLLTVRDCALVDVTDAAGAPWAFDLGFAGQGTGVGCLDLDGDGRRDLVGLNILDPGSSPATVERTRIEVDGTVAAGGARDRVSVPGSDRAGLESARSITCGNRTAAADGVHEAG